MNALIDKVRIYHDGYLQKFELQLRIAVCERIGFISHHASPSQASYCVKNETVNIEFTVVIPCWNYMSSH